MFANIGLFIAIGLAYVGACMDLFERRDDDE